MLGCCSIGMERSRTKHPDDLSWREVGDMGWRYLRIPAALLMVEAIYWFITIPSDTLAPIQVTEAWIWQGLTALIYGDGSVVYTTHNGWWTRVDLYHSNFSGGSIALYVSDECAGVHEMIFISTLVLLTDRVPWKLKKRTIAVMCGIVYVLNIARLVVLYPLAVSSCANDPRGFRCASGMWEFHTFVYQWGFLIVLVIMWLVWFLWVGGPQRVTAASREVKSPLRVNLRREMNGMHWAFAIAGIILVAIALETVFTDDAFQSAQMANNNCTALEEYSPNCANAEESWNSEVGYVWSLATLGIIGIGAAVLDVSRLKIEGEEE